MNGSAGPRVRRNDGRPGGRDFCRTRRDQQDDRTAMLIDEPLGSMGVTFWKGWGRIVSAAAKPWTVLHHFRAES